MLHVLCLFVALLLFNTARGVLVNVTLDDVDYNSRSSDLDLSVSYAGNGWNAVSKMQTSLCQGCTVNVSDISLTMGGTYHDVFVANGASPATINIDFRGVAIYLYFVLYTNALPVTNVTFTLDGEDSGDFQYWKSVANVSGSPDFMYYKPIFSRYNLQDKVHHLTVTTESHQDGGVELLFDAAIITQNLFLSPPPSTPTVPIIAGVLGGLAIIGAAVIAAAYIMRSPRRPRPTPLQLPKESSSSHHIRLLSSFSSRKSQDEQKEPPLGSVTPWRYNPVATNAGGEYLAPPTVGYTDPFNNNQPITTPPAPSSGRTEKMRAIQAQAQAQAQARSQASIQPSPPAPVSNTSTIALTPAQRKRQEAREARNRALPSTPNPNPISPPPPPPSASGVSTYPLGFTPATSAPADYPWAPGSPVASSAALPSPPAIENQNSNNRSFIR